MTNHEKLTHSIKESEMLCAKCPECGERPKIHYDPGATILGCKHKPAAIVLPDFEPKPAMRIWNACVMSGSVKDENIKKQRTRIYGN